ncbi:helix-turn-helix domain-containing protein [Paenibacillus terrigena]|uniref:helix-turn-helix domain-containing protein n=1 Tax=Paenibacillus terrigena TaxID=369333 RepID=UPI0003610942|nr:helix-turn-helix domain-containing protein [Paenibacillus terrigena]
MAIKGQTFKYYPKSLKVEAIRLHMEESWSFRKITEHLEIHDKDRVKKWMRKYRREGQASFGDLEPSMMSATRLWDTAGSRMNYTANITLS